MPNVSQLGRLKYFINGQLAIDNCRTNNSECRNTFAEKATWKVFPTSCRNGRIRKKCSKRDRQDAGEKSNISRSPQARSDSKPNSHSFNKNRNITYCNHFEENKHHAQKYFCLFFSVNNTINLSDYKPVSLMIW